MTLLVYRCSWGVLPCWCLCWWVLLLTMFLLVMLMMLTVMNFMFMLFLGRMVEVAEQPGPPERWLRASVHSKKYVINPSQRSSRSPCYLVRKVAATYSQSSPSFPSFLEFLGIFRAPAHRLPRGRPGLAWLSSHVGSDLAARGALWRAVLWLGFSNTCEQTFLEKLTNWNWQPRNMTVFSRGCRAKWPEQSLKQIG